MSNGDEALGQHGFVLLLGLLRVGKLVVLKHEVLQTCQTAEDGRREAARDLIRVKVERLQISEFHEFRGEIAGEMIRA